jgi:hypothetical protein
MVNTSFSMCKVVCARLNYCLLWSIFFFFFFFGYFLTTCTFDLLSEMNQYQFSIVQPDSSM